MAVIGIDLGTTYSAAAFRRKGEPPEIIFLEGEARLPSVVGLQRNGKIAVGNIAKYNQPKFPQDTVVQVKRKMGTDERIQLGQQSYTPQEISAKILSKIKELAEAELGKPVTGVVISCPAYFTDPARQATKQAGELAGLQVLRIINEPTAAAYAYGVGQGAGDQPRLFLIYDLGDGTFDVTVIKMAAGCVEVIGTGGDSQLGGANFDDCIVEWMFEQLGEEHPEFMSTLTEEKDDALRMRLKSYAEKGKKALCDSTDAEPSYEFHIPLVAQHQGKPIVFNKKLTTVEFERRIGDLVNNSFKWVDEALKNPREKHQYSEDDLTAILMVGGSTRVPLVRRKLAERFPNTPLRGEEEGVHPDEIVALGASIVAAEEDPETDQECDAVLVDVTSHTLSVAVFNDQLQRLAVR